MIQKGSLVQMVEMWDEYPFGWDKSWLEGAVGVVTDYKKITNINDGQVFEMCSIRFITPVVNVKDEPLTVYTAIHVQNLVEIERVPIMTPIIRKPIILSQETE